MSDYPSRYSNESIECGAVANALTVRFLKPHLDYLALDTLASIAEDAHADHSIRALVIHAASQGSDPNQLGELPERYAHRAPSGSHGIGPIVEQTAMRSLHAFSKPLIAYMNGDVNGLAIDIAASCDIRIAASSMTMQDTRILQARTASTGISYLLPKLIGQSQAMRILLLGEKLDANEVERIDFVHQVVPDEDFESFESAFTRKIARMPTRAWQVHKLQVLGQLHLDYESAMVHSLGIRQTHVIQDRKEGMLAWRERRDPNFSGT